MSKPFHEIYSSSQGMILNGEPVDQEGKKRKPIKERRPRKKGRWKRNIGWIVIGLLLLAIFVPQFTETDTVNPAGQTGGMSASIFGNSTALGYIVIAIIAFLLGIAVTIFCFRLRKWQEGKDKQEL